MTSIDTLFEYLIFLSKTDFLEISNFKLADIYLLKVNDVNTRKRCEICSKLIIKTPERPQHNFEHVSHIYLLLT